MAYKVRFSIEANIPDGPAPGGGYARALVGAGGDSVFVESPDAQRNDCGMTVASKTDEVIVNHGDSVFLHYGWVGYYGSPGGLSDNPYVKVTDVEILSISVDGGDWICPTCWTEGFGGFEGEAGSARVSLAAGPVSYGRWLSRLHIFEKVKSGHIS